MFARGYVGATHHAPAAFGGSREYPHVRRLSHDDRAGGKAGTLYVDPHKQVLASVAEKVVVEQYTTDDSPYSNATVATLEQEISAARQERDSLHTRLDKAHSTAVGATLEDLQREQLEIEEQLRLLRLEQNLLEKGQHHDKGHRSASAAPPSPPEPAAYHPSDLEFITGLRDAHTRDLVTLERAQEEMSRAAEEGTHSGHNVDDSDIYFPPQRQTKPLSSYELYTSRRRRNLEVRPFSFEQRELLKQSYPSRRELRKSREYQERKLKENQEVAAPGGCREPFRANVVPPSTFTYKYSIMAAEDFDKRYSKSKPRAKTTDDQPAQRIWCSEPLLHRHRARTTDDLDDFYHAMAPTRGRDDTRSPSRNRSRSSYVSAAERMASHKFKARPVPASVKTPKWRQMVESEVLRKFDIKEMARYKHAECEQYAPKRMMQYEAKKMQTQEPKPRQQSVPAHCSFKPRVNHTVPNYLQQWQREEARKAQCQLRKTLTEVQEFKLSRPSGSRTAAVIQREIEEEMRRKAPKPRPAPRCRAVTPPRHTHASTCLLIKRSMDLEAKVQEERKRKQEEERLALKQQEVQLRVNREERKYRQPREKHEGFHLSEEVWPGQRKRIIANVKQQPPLWLRVPQAQEEEAARRASAEEVAARKKDSDDEGGDDGVPEVGSPKAGSDSGGDAPRVAEEAKKEDKGDDSDTSSDSYSD